jgi:gluconokinase
MMINLTAPNQPEPPLILTIDIGTSSTRALVYDRLGRRVEGVLAQIPHHLHTTADGGAELDPSELLESVIQAIDQALQQTGALAEKIGGVAMDTLVTNIIGLDRNGTPVTPIFTYADTRSTPDANTLRQAFDLAAVHDRTGCRLHSSYLPARFEWLARTRPDRLKAAAYWLSLGEYLFETFFGQRVVSYSVASWTGLLNRHELEWDQTWLSYLPIDAVQLSSLVDVDQPLTGLQAEWAERWPVLKAIPWFPAIGDGAAANIGSGCDNPHKVALTIGSTGAMRVVLEQSIDPIPEGLWVYRVDHQHALLGGATTEGGNVFAWLSDTLQLPAEVETELAQMPPAGHGLTMLPFVAGERAPGWRDDARASLIGFSLNTRPIDILRAGLEAVAYRFALIHRLMTPHLPPDHEMIASGAGLLNSPAWLQIMADVLGRPLIALAEKEATSRGVALLALAALGFTQEKPAAAGTIYRPHSEHHALYQEALARQVEMYERLLGPPSS